MAQVRRTGIEPLLVLKLTYPEGSGRPTMCFSNRELLDWESPIEGLPIHGHVLSFSAISSSSKIDGFGNLESTEVTLHDFFGFFKELLEEVNLYDIQVELFLVVKQPPLRSEVTRIIYGRFSDPIVWDEGARSVTLGVISNVIFGDFGHQPDYYLHEYLNRNLTGNPWPHIFGKLQTYRFEPVCNNPSATLGFGLVFIDEDPDNPIEGAFYDTYPQGTEDDKVYRGASPGITTIYLEEGSGLGLPDSSEGQQCYMLGIPADTKGYMHHKTKGISTKEDHILFFGIASGAVDRINTVTGWNTPYYGNICVWGPPQYSMVQPFQSDKQNYIPNTMRLLGYGHFEDSGANIFGEPATWPGVVDNIFPLEGESPDSDPWLEGQYIYYLAFRAQRNSDGTFTMHYATLFGTVTNQTGLNITVDDITDVYGRDRTSSGYTPCFIYYSAYNKLFKPASTSLCGHGSSGMTSFGSSQTRWPTPQIACQNGNRDLGQYVVRTSVDDMDTITEEDDITTLIFDRMYKIPKGGSIKPVNWWPTMLFPITLDTETSIGSIGIVNGDRHIPLSISHWDYIKYDKSEVGADRWKNGITGAEVGPMSSGGPVPNVYYDEDFEEYLPDKVAFIRLKPTGTNMIARGWGEDIAILEVTCGNTIDTDERIFKWVLEKYTNLTGVLATDLYYHHPTECKVMRKEAVTSFLGQLSWENCKLIRVEASTARLIDLLKPCALPSTLPTFSESNIENDQFKLAYTADSEIYNYMVATAQDSWVEGKIIEKNQESIDRFTKREISVSILCNRRISTIADGYDNTTVSPLDNTHWEDSIGRLVPTDDDNDPETPDIYVETLHLGRGYNRVLKYWLYQYSRIWLQVQFNTFLDSILPKVSGGERIVGSDLVNINMGVPLSILTDADGIPNNVLPNYGTPAGLPVAYGYVTEVNITPSDGWVVSMNVRLPIELGSNTPQYVVD